MATYHYYLDEAKDSDLVVRVKSLRRPVQRKRPFVVETPYEDKGFQMSPFPEISYNRLNKMKYIGKTKHSDSRLKNEIS